MLFRMKTAERQDGSGSDDKMRRDRTAFFMVKRRADR
jgi:hypothetical protein